MDPQTKKKGFDYWGVPSSLYAASIIFAVYLTYHLQHKTHHVRFKHMVGLRGRRRLSNNVAESEFQVYG